MLASVVAVIYSLFVDSNMFSYSKSEILSGTPDSELRMVMIDGVTFLALSPHGVD